MKLSKLAYPFKTKLGKIIIFLVLVAAIVFGLWKFGVIKLGSQTASTSNQRMTTVRRGDIAVKVSGTGTVVPYDKIEISPNVNGTITKVGFKQGDKVKKNDVLFRIDDSDQVLDITKIQNSTKQAEQTLKDNIDNIEKQKVIAPFSGQASNISVKVGDVISKNAQILNLVDKSKLKLSVYFAASSAVKIAQGQEVSVNIQDLAQSVKGTVSYISNGSYSTTAGEKLINVDVEIKNPGALEAGMKASVTAGIHGIDVTSATAGTLSFIDNVSVKSGVAGTVKAVNVLTDQVVDAGYLLVELEDDSLALSKSNSELQLAELRAQLESANNQFSYYTIRAPFDGEIVKQDMNVNDIVKTTDTISTIIGDGNMKMSVSIDELDIAKVKEGMDVSITVDALPETSTKPISGKVSSVSAEGTASNGVATYAVDILVDRIEGLKSGMNAQAEILVNNRQNVLYVPVEAVQKQNGRSYVTVLVPKAGANVTQKTYGTIPTGGGVTQSTYRAMPAGGNVTQRTYASRNGQGTVGTTGDNSQYAGRQRTQQQQQPSADAFTQEIRYIETGVSDATNIEIVSGLNEREIVSLPQLASSATTTSTQTQQRSIGGIMGGGGGGATFTRQGATGGR